MKHTLIVALAFTLCFFKGYTQHTSSFDSPNYIRAAVPTDPSFSEGLWLGQGFVVRPGAVDIRPAFIPDNKPTWAIAVAVAWNMERNLIDRIRYPQMNSYLGTAVLESELRCATGLTWSDSTHVPTNYDSSIVYPAQINNGCFQIEGPGSAFSLLLGAYPGRLKHADYNVLVQGVDGFEASAILKALFNVYGVVTFDKYKQWDLMETFDCTSDSLAYVKTTASIYNGGFNAFTSASSYFDGSYIANSCWTGLPAVTVNYANNVSAHVVELDNDTSHCDHENGASFDSYYNKDIEWQDVRNYMSVIDTMYKELDWEGVIVPKVQSIFNEFAINGKVAFQELGPVVDAIIKSLPKEYPTMIDGNPIGIDLAQLSVVPEGEIKGDSQKDTIKLGETLRLKLSVTSRNDSSKTYQWFNLQDTSTVLGTEKEYDFKPSTKGVYQLGAKICSGTNCLFIGCDPNVNCFDSRRTCGYTITVLDSSACSFSVSQVATTNASCSADKSGAIQVTLNKATSVKVTVDSQTAEGESTEVFTSSTQSFFFSGMTGLYNLTIVDLNDTTCQVKTSATIGSDQASDYYLEAKKSGSFNCEDTLQARLLPINSECKLRVRVWAPIFFQWENYFLVSLSSSVGQEYTGRYNRTYQAGDFDQWNVANIVEQWFDINENDTLFFSSIVQGVVGAKQYRKYTIEVSDDQGTVLHSITIPAGSTLYNTTQDLGYFVSTCGAKEADYNFVWNPSLTNTVTTGSFNEGYQTNANQFEFYNVTASPKTGNCSVNKTVAVEPNSSCVVTSVNENEGALDLYPNPTEGSVSMSNEYYGTVKILSMKGRLVNEMQKNSATMTIDLSALPRGSYFVVLNTENGTYRSKIIKL